MFHSVKYAQRRFCTNTLKTKKSYRPRVRVRGNSDRKKNLIKNINKKEKLENI